MVTDARWLRFFALASSLFAIKESCPLVPNTPGSIETLIPELSDLWNDLRVESFLKGCIVTTDLSQRDAEKSDRVLLILNAKTKTLEIRRYRAINLLDATRDLAEAEKTSTEQPEIDAVLVEVESLTKLRIAYPNYFSDTTDFVETIAGEIEGSKKR